MKKLKVVCVNCGKVWEFKNEREAYLAGWDFLRIGKRDVCVCDKCPSAPLIINESDSKE